MGILDDVDLLGLGNDENLPPATELGTAAALQALAGEVEAIAASVPVELRARQLLTAERVGFSRAAARWGHLAGRLESVSPALREGFAVLNVDRMMRRMLNSGGLEPETMLPALLGGAEADVKKADKLAAMGILESLLPLIQALPAPESVAAARVWTALRRWNGWAGTSEDLATLAEEIADARGVVEALYRWYEGYLGDADPLFLITDLMAAHGPALMGAGWLDDVMKDQGSARPLEVALEALRPPQHRVGGVPDEIILARSIAHDGSIMGAIDLVMATAAARAFGFAPISGFVRRELMSFEDSHYPRDVAMVSASVLASVEAAERDLECMVAFEQLRGRTLGSAQATLLAATVAWGPALPSRLAVLAGVAKSNVASALAPFAQAEVVDFNGDYWRPGSIERQ